MLQPLYFLNLRRVEYNFSVLPRRSSEVPGQAGRRITHRSSALEQARRQTTPAVSLSDGVTMAIRHV